MRNFTQRTVKLMAMIFCMALVSVSAFAFPTPTTNYKNLHIIDTVQVDLQMTTTEGDWVATDINPLLEYAGISIEEAAPHIGEIMYMWQYDHSEYAEDYYVSDELWALGVWGYWWFGFADDAKTTFVADNWSENCFGWTGGNVELGEDGVCWIFFGPYNGAEAGQQAHSQMYAIIGNDAILVNIDVEIVGPTIRTPDECTLVGETVVYANNQVSNGWNGKKVNFNLQEALDSLGCGVADLQFYIVDADGNLNPNFTANAGFWMTMDGELAPYEYGTKTWFVELNTNNGSLNVGHMPEVFVGDGTEVCHGEVYLGFYELIYKLDVTMTVIPDRELPTEFVEKGYEELYLQGLALEQSWSSGYNVQLNYERARQLTECELGDELVLYAKTEDGAWNNISTVTTPDGFWFTPEGYHTYYGDNSAFFIENVYGGVIGNWGHMAGLDEPGTTYTGEFYYMNESNGYYYTIRYRVDYVEEVLMNEQVGEEDVTVIASYDGQLTSIDIAPALEALGIEDSEVPEDALWVVPAFATLFDQTNYTGEAYIFDAEGNTCDIDTEEGAASAVYLLGYFAEEGGFYAEAWQDMDEDSKYTTTLALQYGNKYYVYHITVVSPEGAEVGISSIATSAGKNGYVYNLSGQRVDGSYRGFVIKNGKVTWQK